MSQGETTPWGTFDEIGRPHYLYLHNGVVFQATVGNLNGIYAAWLQPGTSNRLIHNIVSNTPRFSHYAQEPGLKSRGEKLRGDTFATPKQTQDTPSLIHTAHAPTYEA